MKTLWFKAKYYGYGWYPSAWQGWAILIIYIYLIIDIFRIIDRTSHSASDTLVGVFVPFILLSILLLFICYGTGEKPRWRWRK